MVITSVSNDKIKNIKKLRSNKEILSQKKYIIEGDNLVREAYNCNLLEETLSLDDANYGVKNTIVSDNVMKHLSNLSNITNVIGICKVKDDNIDFNGNIIILDGIQDPGNLGTIIRSACAFDFKTIILGNRCVSKYNDKVIRSSEGMIFKSNIVSCNLLEIIPKLIDNGYLVYGTNVINGVNVTDINHNNKLAIVIGSEGNGISEDVSKLIENNLYINMNSNCESLNASVAASIIMYELSK